MIAPTYYDESTALIFTSQAPTKVFRRKNTYYDKTRSEQNQPAYVVRNIDSVAQFQEIEYVSVDGIQTSLYWVVRNNRNIITTLYFTTYAACKYGQTVRIKYYTAKSKAYNSYTDLGLVPKERPRFVPAQPKTNFTELDGSSRYFDYTDVIDDTVFYSPSTGTWSFYLLNGDGYDWQSAYSKVRNTLNGKLFRVSFPDTQNWYRKARLEVTDIKPGKNWSEVSIKYTADPYEMYKYTTNQTWLWDDFNFDNDSALEFDETSIAEAASSGTWWSAVDNTYYNGYQWNSPWFTWTAGTVFPQVKHGNMCEIYIRWRGEPDEDDEGTTNNTDVYDLSWSVQLPTGESRANQLYFKNGQIQFCLKEQGKDTVSISTRVGRL